MRRTWGLHPQPSNKYSTVILGLYQPLYPQVFISPHQSAYGAGHAFGSSKEIKERKPTRGRQRCFSNWVRLADSPSLRTTLGLAAHSLIHVRREAARSPA